MKRYIDTDLWQKQWYMDLSLKLKLLVRYMYDNCDCVGVFTANWRLISFLINTEVTEDDICEINNHKAIIEKLENGKFFIKGFVEFQYGELTTSCKPHIRYMEELKKHGLYERVCKGYAKGINTLEEKEQEKEKEKGLLGEKPMQPDGADIVLEKEEKLYPEVNIFEAYMHKWNAACETMFNRRLSQIKEMTHSRINKLRTRLKETEFDFAKILAEIKQQPFCLGENKQKWKVSFDWVIENDRNYLKILEGNYKSGGETNGRNTVGGNAAEYAKVIKK